MCPEVLILFLCSMYVHIPVTYYGIRHISPCIARIEPSQCAAEIEDASGE